MVRVAPADCQMNSTTYGAHRRADQFCSLIDAIPADRLADIRWP